METNILSLFAYHRTLTFSELEKLLAVRSNKLAYHLKRLCAKGKLEKAGLHYRLTETAEPLIPYLSSSTTPLPVVLIHVGTKTHAFLTIRKKRPYLGHYGLPGGRLKVGETVSQAARRIMSEKFGIAVQPSRRVSFALEQVKKDNTIVHSFLLILVHAKTNEKIILQNIAQKKKAIIPSDYALLSTPQKKTLLSTIYSRLA